MGGWHYVKSGLMGNETIGPVTDQDLLQLAYDGEIDTDTQVTHPTHTKGQWATLSRIPSAVERANEGVVHRQQLAAAAKEEKQRQKAEAKAAATTRKQQALAEAAERKEQSPIRSFLLDGQTESVVAKIYERVQNILTSGEAIEYIAVQAKPVQVAPDCAVLTNRRLIIFHQKVLGRMSFDDFLWRDLHDAHLAEGVMFAKISMKDIRGRAIALDYLPKEQARRIYRISQEREEEAIEVRRRREMEESRAGAANLVVNAPAGESQAASSVEDPIEKLAKLKKMLDAGLIEQDEFDATKKRILDSM